MLEHGGDMFSTLKYYLLDCVMTIIVIQLPCGGKDTHQLLERFEWLTEFEFDIQLINLYKICSKGSEVIGIIPLP